MNDGWTMEQLKALGEIEHTTIYLEHIMLAIIEGVSNQLQPCYDVTEATFNDTTCTFERLRGGKKLTARELNDQVVKPDTVVTLVFCNGVWGFHAPAIV